MYNNSQLNENLEQGDLKRLVTASIHIDEYKSKMGDDADVCVVCFKVAGKEHAIDLVIFVEKGYDWVLDADVSSGEKEGGDYLVFIELERTPELPKQINMMVSDINNLTEFKLEDHDLDWNIIYDIKSKAGHEFRNCMLKTKMFFFGNLLKNQMNIPYFEYYGTKIILENGLLMKPSLTQINIDDIYAVVRIKYSKNTPFLLRGVPLDFDAVYDIKYETGEEFKSCLIFRELVSIHAVDIMVGYFFDGQNKRRLIDGIMMRKNIKETELLYKDRKERFGDSITKHIMMEELLKGNPIIVEKFLNQMEIQ
jgi:hypothetical protein